MRFPPEEAAKSLRETSNRPSTGSRGTLVACEGPPCPPEACLVEFLGRPLSMRGQRAGCPITNPRVARQAVWLEGVFNRRFPKRGARCVPRFLIEVPPAGKGVNSDPRLPSHVGFERNSRMPASTAFEPRKDDGFGHLEPWICSHDYNSRKSLTLLRRLPRPS